MFAAVREQRKHSSSEAEESCLHQNLSNVSIWSNTSKSEPLILFVLLLSECAMYGLFIQRRLSCWFSTKTDFTPLVKHGLVQLDYDRGCSTRRSLPRRTVENISSSIPVGIRGSEAEDMSKANVSDWYAEVMRCSWKKLVGSNETIDFMVIRTSCVVVVRPVHCDH